MSQVDYSRRDPKTNGRRFITVLILVVVLCLVSFSLGLMVGKSGKPAVETTQIQTVPLPPQPKTAAPQALPDSAPEAPVPDDKAADATTELAEQPTSNDPLRELLPPVEQMPLGSGINHDAEQDTPATEPVVPATAVTDAVPAKEVVTAPVVVQPQPVTAVTATAVGYAVQVASFKHRQDAETMSAKLGKDFPVVVRQADLGKKGVWYRVLVGPVATKAEAETLKQDLKKKASTDGFIKKISA
ncbi:SPOR domain-containing protein [uncultured Desulfuromonas sp.]|uniref:SPOR domain-containing protein n=1 Tax=uncultured Desulfuromonas sp. TaxID=181013 RepID=UPI002AAB0DFD|nr:SPOR domain-containing protein [uncultured Desulfuromonas sp.]